MNLSPLAGVGGSLIIPTGRKKAFHIPQTGDVLLFIAVICDAGLE
jgi:hypothetical protein